jgi:hypothetical protein
MIITTITSSIIVTACRERRGDRRGDREGDATTGSLEPLVTKDIAHVEIFVESATAESSGCYKHSSGPFIAVGTRANRACRRSGFHQGAGA